MNGRGRGVLPGSRHLPLPIALLAIACNHGDVACVADGDCPPMYTCVAHACQGPPGDAAGSPEPDDLSMGPAEDLGDDLGKGLDPAPPPTLMGPQGLLLTDLNRDGRDDILVTDRIEGALWVMLSRPDGSPGPAVQAAATASSYSLAAADFNEDGSPDVVVGDGGQVAMTVFLGSRKGQLTRVPPRGAGVTVADLPRSLLLAAADFDGDGHVDLIGCDGATGTLVNGRGDGTFTSSQFGGPYRVELGGGVRSLQVIDLNGDGLPDLLAGASSSQAAVLLIDQGVDKVSGQFLGFQVTPIQVGAIVTSAWAADLDGNKLIDLFVTTRKGELVVTLNNGTRQAASFGALRSFDLGGAIPEAMAVANFNGDAQGLPDIAAIDPTGKVTMLYSSALGNGTFGNRFARPVGKDPIAVAEGDLNGDGKPDVVTLNASSLDLTVLLTR